MKAKTRERIGLWGMTAGAVVVIGAVSVTVTRVVVVHIQMGAFTPALVLSIAALIGMVLVIPRVFREATRGS